VLGAMGVGLLWMINGQTASTAQIKPAVTPKIEPVVTPTLSTPFEIKVKTQIDVEKQFLHAYQQGKLSTWREKGFNEDELQVTIESWSPDEQHILLEARTGDTLVGKFPNDPPDWSDAYVPTYDLWLADNQGNPLKLLAENASWTAWSPDSLSVTYVQDTIVNGEFEYGLWLINITGVRQKLLSYATQVVWLDNNTIVFMDKERHLQLIDKKGENIRPLSIQGLAYEMPEIINYTFSPDKQWLAVQPSINLTSLHKVDLNIRVIALTGEQGKVVADIETPDSSHMFWSPDSHSLAYSAVCVEGKIVSKVGCQWINIVDTTGRQVNRIEGYSSLSVAWSADNQHLLFADGDKLYLSNVETSEVETLSLPSSKFHNLYWLSNKQIISFNQDPLSGAKILILEAK